MEERVYVFAASALVTGLAGLAALLRSSQPITWLGIAGTFLNSSLLGLGLSLVWYGQFETAPHALVGILVLVGLSGQPTLEFILKLFLRGGLGFSITIGDKKVNLDEDAQEPAEKNKEKKP